MAMSPLAGKPAPENVLIDVSALEHAYHANQPDPSVTRQADPEIHRQSPIDLVDVVLRARPQVPLDAKVNGVPGHHRNRGLHKRPFQEARFPTRTASIETDPPSTPSTGNAMGSSDWRAPST